MGGLPGHTGSKASRHRVFISFHHANDESFKDALVRMNQQHGIFTDALVDTMGIDDRLPDQSIRQIIRDEYLRDSTVTVLLVGTETRKRKHIDWEIYSSMYDGTVNKKSGILVVILPSAYGNYLIAAHANEKELVYPEISSWLSVANRSDYEAHFPHLPARIIDNLVAPGAMISVTPWEKVASSPDVLGFLIDAAHKDRMDCKYDLSRPMRRANS